MRACLFGGIQTGSRPCLGTKSNLETPNSGAFFRSWYPFLGGFKRKLRGKPPFWGRGGPPFSRRAHRVKELNCVFPLQTDLTKRHTQNHQDGPKPKKIKVRELGG